MALDERQRRALAWAFRVLLAVLSIVAIIYLAGAVQSVSLAEIRQWHGQLNGPMAALSLVIGIAHVVAASWMIVLLLPFGARSGMLAIILMSQIAKYVPGKIWGVAMQKALATSLLGTMPLASANVVGMALVVLAQGSVFFAAVAWRWGGALTAATVVFSVGFVLYLSLTLVVRLAKKMQRLDWQHDDEPHWCFRLTLAWFATTSTLFGAWAVLFSGALGLDVKLVLDGIILSTASFIAGLISIFPAGIGVREGAFLWLGENIAVASTSLLIGLAVVTRLYLLTLDACSSIVGFCIHVYQRLAR